MKQFIVEVYYRGVLAGQSMVWATHAEDAIEKYRVLYYEGPMPSEVSKNYSFSAALPDHSQFETKA